MSGPQQKKKKAGQASKDNSGTVGCLVVVVLVFLFVGLPIGWSMYDEGVFDGNSARGSANDPIFGARESGRLAERLAEASKVQNVCYGWEIDSDRSFVNRVTPIYSGTFTPEPVPTEVGAPTIDRSVEIGSNLGVGVDPRQVPVRCPKWVIFTADYNYSFIDEEWTAVTSGIETNLGGGLSGYALDDLGLTNKELLGDNAGMRLADAVGALPLLVSERGAAPPVPALAPQTPPAGDKVAGPGKGRYIVMGIAILLIAGGLVWIIAAAARSRRSGS